MVVFLVALPLCVGVAVASGVPPALGIVTGIVGGIVVGLMPGSTMQVSGPAAGLTVLVASTVAEHGLAVLGVVVFGSGLVQLGLGLLRAGTWFRAISPSVVQGMLAGIGLMLILGQVYPAVGVDQPPHTPEKLGGLPHLIDTAITTGEGRSALAVTALTLAVVVAWPGRRLPGALVGVVLASVVTALFGLPLRTIDVGSPFTSLTVPGPDVWAGALTPAVLGAMLTFALIASAESLFSAAAVDRMHDRPKTRYDQELVAQGAGNALCGLLGALPMTAVIVRSSANVSAGARTKASRVLHGVWLLLFAALLPGVLNSIPAAALAALLLHAGWKLLEVRQVATLVQQQRSEGALVLVTAGAIVATDLLIGVLTGLAAAVAKTAIDVSRLSVRSEHGEDHVRVVLDGNATFLRLPRLLDQLERLPTSGSVHLDLTTVRHLDRACRQAVEHWAAQRRRSDCEVEVVLPPSG